MGLPIRHRTITADTTATHSNTTTEAAFSKTITIPANTLRVGDVIKGFAIVKASATNSSDTLKAYAMLGTAATSSSTGLVLATNTAYDVADGDCIALNWQWEVTALGAAGTASLSGYGVGSPTTLYTVAGASTVATYLATTSDLYLYVVADWSAASTGDVCHLRALHLEVIPANPTASP